MQTGVGWLVSVGHVCTTRSVGLPYRGTLGGSGRYEAREAHVDLGLQCDQKLNFMTFQYYVPESRGSFKVSPAGYLVQLQ
jgi:hypothetical protein